MERKHLPLGLGPPVVGLRQRGFGDADVILLLINKKRNSCSTTEDVGHLLKLFK